MPSYFDQYGPNYSDQGGNAAADWANYISSGDFTKRPPAGWMGNGQPTPRQTQTAPTGAPAQQGVSQSGTPSSQHGALWRLLHSIFGGGQSQGSNAPGQVQSQPLPPLPGTSETSSPFGGWPQQQSQGQAAAPSQGAPVSKLASAQEITDRINKMIGTAGPQNMPPPDFSQPGGPNAPLPDFTSDQSPFDIYHMGPTPGSRPTIDLSRAEGGPVPGFMRGGYPELYTRPVRQTFDSGGESYVKQGEGGGRSDNINARLSPREFVTDAETVALLGDGNPDEGARKMEELRVNIRKHKGNALAKGKISPDAKKSAAEYLVGNPLGDGLRRRGRERK